MDAEVRPSMVTELPWLYAERKTFARPKDVSRSGKWMVFAGLSYIDEVWAKIKHATEEGLLGEISKVSTQHPHHLALNHRSGVICVYVTDSSDEVEKARVHQALVDLGFAKPIFKTDADTLMGKYSEHIQRNRRKLER